MPAPNGTPVVNIQTPSAAGVSRDTYSQFDVQCNGAILNNSRTNVQTQLGGWVQGNPWLATGSARVILNEVNSSNPSQLRGFIEVAGQRAEIIIANPAGIQVDGAGFINASRATLTTGTPVLNGSNLESYRVQRGVISINGAGLDATLTDHTGILARAIEVNAGLWANHLKLVTGANDIRTDQGSVSANAAAAQGTAPQFAMDVAQIGGMYAGKIHLIGTDGVERVELRRTEPHTVCAHRTGGAAGNARRVVVAAALAVVERHDGRQVAIVHVPCLSSRRPPRFARGNCCHRTRCRRTRCIKTDRLSKILCVKQWCVR